MPKRPKYFLARVGNFAKVAFEKLSPRKRRKTDDKENVCAL
jgi:hypothetical protein